MSLQAIKELLLEELTAVTEAAHVPERQWPLLSGNVHVNRDYLPFVTLHNIH